VGLKVITEEDQKLIDELNATANDIELKSIEFLNAQGKIGHKRSGYVTIRMVFHDGRVIVMPRRLEEHFQKQEFKLRPMRDDA
jgi:hypothetical protein